MVNMEIPVCSVSPVEAVSNRPRQSLRSWAITARLRCSAGLEEQWLLQTRCQECPAAPVKWHLQGKHNEHSWCTGWEAPGTAVVVLTERHQAPLRAMCTNLLKPSTTLVSTVVRKYGPGENLGAQEFVMALNSSVPAGTAWKEPGTSPGLSLAAACPAHLTHPPCLSWLSCCWAVSIGLSQPNNSTTVTYTFRISIKNLKYWKTGCFLHLYILQPRVKHLQGRQLIFENITPFITASPKKTTKMLIDYIICIFDFCYRWYKVGFKKEADI